MEYGIQQEERRTKPPKDMEYKISRVKRKYQVNDQVTDK